MRESTCVLSAPELKNQVTHRRQKTRLRSGREKEAHSLASSHIVHEREFDDTRDYHQPLPRAEREPSVDGADLTPALSTRHSLHLEATNPVELTPLPQIIEASRILHQLFGVSLGHPPTFLQQLRDGDYDQLKVCAMLAVCARFVPELVKRHGSTEEAGEIYAGFVRREINAKIGQGPRLETIHCLLLIAMHEWGQGYGFSAWMYAGKS